MNSKLSFAFLRPLRLWVMTHLPAVILFALISLAYFHPVMSGRAIFQSDIAQYQGMARETIEYRQRTGEESYWNNSAFGGMPTYQLGAQYPNYALKYLDRSFRFLPRPADYLFLYFIGLYLLLITMKVPRLWAIFGAISFGFSTYLIIILGVGHNAKAHAIAYFPWVIAAILWTLKGRYKSGFIFGSIAFGLEIMANHFQMTYYLLLAVIILWIILGWQAWKTGNIRAHFRGTSVLIAASLMALSLNAATLMATSEYAQESTRGPAVLSIDPDGSPKKKSSGLDYNYITEYSYSPLESFNLWVPRFMGGATNEALPKDSQTVAALRKLGASRTEAQEIANQIPMYWGDQPIVAAPAYIGGVVLTLVVLALLLYRGPLNLWIISVVILALLLSWGRHFSWLTDLFIRYVPMYDKFRAVSSTQVLIEFLMPLLAVLGGVAFVNESKSASKKAKLILFRAASISLGLLAVLYLCSFGVLEFSSPYDDYFMDQLGMDFVRAIREDRASLLRSDVLMALFFTISSVFALWGIAANKWSKQWGVIALIVLSAIDLVSVDLRYVNEDDFVQKRLVERPFQPTEVDLVIAQDSSYFRVFDQSSAAFNSARANYFHRQLGGYHAAKPRRMQDLYDFYLAEAKPNILDMFNVKYLIGRDERGSGVKIQINPNRNGPVWFVDSVMRVATSDEELLGLKDLNTRDIAYVNSNQFETEPNWANLMLNVEDLESVTDSIYLVSHRPNKMVYRSQSNRNRIAVFSEVYYPHGWQISVDGQRAEMFRANYVLRAMIIPSGTHDIVFEFDPEVVQTGRVISLTSVIALILIALFLIWKYPSQFIGELNDD